MSELSRTPLAALALVLAALLACDFEPESLPYARLGIVIASSVDGGAPAPPIASSACVLLPVLRGSRIEKSFPVAGSLSVGVVADRERAVVSFDNAAPAVSERSVSRDELEQGYSQQVEVFANTGARFVVVLSSECEPDAATW